MIEIHFLHHCVTSVPFAEAVVSDDEDDGDLEDDCCAASGDVPVVAVMT